MCSMFLFPNLTGAIYVRISHLNCHNRLFIDILCILLHAISQSCSLISADRSLFQANYFLCEYSQHPFSMHALQTFFLVMYAEPHIRIPSVSFTSFPLVIHECCAFNAQMQYECWVKLSVRRAQKPNESTHSPVSYNRVSTHKPTMLSSLLCRALIA